MTDTIGFRLELAGAEQVAAGFDKVTGALTAQQQAYANAGQQLQQFGTGLQQASGVMNMFSPGLGEMGGQIAHVTSLLGTMVTQGINPLQIAVMAAAAGLQLWSKDAQEMQARSERLSAAIDEHRARISDLVAVMRERQAVAREDARLATGGGSPEEYEAKIADLLEQRAIVTRELTQDELSFAGAHAELQAQGRETLTVIRESIQEYNLLRDSTRDLAEAHRELATAIASASTEKEKRGRQQLAALHRGGGRGGTTLAERDAADTAREAGNLGNRYETAHSGDTAIDVSSENDRNAAKEMQHIQALGRAEADLDAHRRARADERMRREDADFRRRLDNIHAEAEQLAQYGGQIADIFIQASHTQGDFGKAVAAGFRSELEGLGKTELIKGLSDEAEAIGLAFVNPPAAGAKAISGAQHLAVSALAFGGSAIAGAAAGSGTAAGGGGSTPSRPLHSGGGSGGSGGDTYTFNILGPMITESGKAALGRTLDDITRAARRRLGTRADGTST